MASTAKVLSSSFQVPAARSEPAIHVVPAPAPRERSGWLALLREGLGGALVLAAVIVLWTITWAAIAGPLSPATEAPQSAAVASVERAR